LAKVCVAAPKRIGNGVLATFYWPLPTATTDCHCSLPLPTAAANCHYNLQTQAFVTFVSFLAQTPHPTCLNTNALKVISNSARS
jgi:hypothetical protein